MMSEMGLGKHLSHHYITQVAANLSAGAIRRGARRATYNRSRRLREWCLGPFDEFLRPEALGERETYEYDTTARAPLSGPCSGHQGRVEALQAWMWSLLTGWLDAQTMLHVYGPLF
jgi:hypothetical protein